MRAERIPADDVGTLSPDPRARIGENPHPTPPAQGIMHIETLAIAHVALLALWGGVVATEVIVELHAALHPPLQDAAARFHLRIDLILELPLILGVIASGSFLLAHAWPPTSLHLVKLACVAVPILSNLACVALVVMRARSLDSGASASVPRAHTRRIFVTALVGVPFAFAGAVLGAYLAAERMASVNR